MEEIITFISEESQIEGVLDKSIGEKGVVITILILLYWIPG